MALNAQIIVETAHRLLGHYGLQDVTMRRLASELGVRPGALYYHLSSKQEVLIRVAQRVLAPLSDPLIGAEGLMLRLRETILPLRDGGDLLAIAYALDHSIPPVPAVQTALAQEGRADADATELTGQLMRFAVGSIVTEQNAELLGSGTGPGVPADLYANGLRRLLA